MSDQDVLHQLVVADLPREIKAAADLTLDDVPELLAGTVLPFQLDLAKEVYKLRSMVFAGFKQNAETLDSVEERLQAVEDLELGDSQLTPEDADLFHRICIALQGTAESMAQAPDLTAESTAMIAHMRQIAQEGLNRIEEIAMSDDDDEQVGDDGQQVGDAGQQAEAAAATEPGAEEG